MSRPKANQEPSLGEPWDGRGTSHGQLEANRGVGEVVVKENRGTGVGW
ncbi:MAG: hypothetical protein J5711_08030 [Bacteroidales bacterium]|nr:hypothetical protein [Bacteroidales bacterium]